MQTENSGQKKHIITIAGRPGSGKSTTAKEVAKELDFRHFSSGDYFRKLGAERGADVLRANRAPGITEELDRLVDEKLRSIGANDDKIVIDSRTAWHWIPSSYKVFLDLDLEVAARRILSKMTDERAKSENISGDPAKYAKELELRLEVETKRYKTLYGINPYDMSNYNLVVDTLANDVREVVGRVVRGFEDWIKR